MKWYFMIFLCWLFLERLKVWARFLASWVLSSICVLFVFIYIWILIFGKAVVRFSFPVWLTFNFTQLVIYYTEFWNGQRPN